MPVALHQKVIGTIVGLALVITAASAAPARADSEDVNRALAAIVGLAIVGAAIANANNDDHPRVQTHVYSNPRPRQVQPRHVQPRPLPNVARGKILPAHCMRHFQVNKGHLRAFGHRCLQNNFAGTRYLPAQCHRKIQARGGHRNVYGLRCLRQYGYEIARR